MTAQSFEHLIPIGGDVLDRPLSEIFGFNRAGGPSKELREDMRLIRESEARADEVGAKICLY